jgi:putative Holliday junction resolvase
MHMPLSIRPLAEFPDFLRPPARLVAMDIGSRTIGLALSTPDWQMALPLTTIRRAKWHEDIKALDKALSGYGIGGIIVGLPLNDDDSIGPAAQGIKQTIANLIKEDLKWVSPDGMVAFWDERFSTAMAQETLFDNHNTKTAKSSGALDAMAAQIILERALDYLNNHIKNEA